MPVTFIKLKSARKRGEKTIPTLEVRFPDPLPKLSELYGEAIVANAAVSTLRQQIADWARKELTRKRKDGSVTPTIEQLQAILNNGGWQPSATRRGKSLADKATELLKKMSLEEQMEFRKALVGGTEKPPEHKPSAPPLTLPIDNVNPEHIKPPQTIKSPEDMAKTFASKPRE